MGRAPVAPSTPPASSRIAHARLFRIPAPGLRPGSGQRLFRGLGVRPRGRQALAHRHPGRRRQPQGRAPAAPHRQPERLHLRHPAGHHPGLPGPGLDRRARRGRPAAPAARRARAPGRAALHLLRRGLQPDHLPAHRHGRTGPQDHRPGNGRKDRPGHRPAHGDLLPPLLLAHPPPGLVRNPHRQAPRLHAQRRTRLGLHRGRAAHAHRRHLLPRPGRGGKAPPHRRAFDFNTTEPARP